MAINTVDVTDGVRTVKIRERMGFGIRSRVQSDAVRVSIDNTTGKPLNRFDIGLYQTALLLHNIVAWSGEGLDGVPITREALDDFPIELGDMVLRRIQELNETAAKESPDPKP